MRELVVDGILKGREIDAKMAGKDMEPIGSKSQSSSIKSVDMTKLAILVILGIAAAVFTLFFFAVWDDATRFQAMSQATHQSNDHAWDAFWSLAYYFLAACTFVAAVILWGLFLRYFAAGVEFWWDDINGRHDPVREPEKVQE